MLEGRSCVALSEILWGSGAEGPRGRLAVSNLNAVEEEVLSEDGPNRLNLELSRHQIGTLSSHITKNL